MAEVKTSLRLVLIEDREADAKLVLRQLRRAGLAFKALQVGSEDAMVAALEAGGVDVILSDYHLPGYDVRRALRLAKARLPDVPFLVVSGSMQEDIGVELMKLGADDYLLKDRLERLGSAVEQALDRARERAVRRQTEERLSAVLESVPVVVFGIRADGVFSLAQGRGLDAWAPDSPIVGKKAATVLRQEPKLLEMITEALAGTPAARSIHLDLLDRDLDVHVSPVLDSGGRVIQVFGVAADVTERRAGERALLENEAKSRFLANMSHELRNPLNSVLGFAQLLTSMEVANLSEKQISYLRNIEQSGRQLLDLVNDVLDLSKIVSYRLSVSLGPVAVDDVFDTCLSQMQPQASARSVGLDRAGPGGLFMFADRRRVLQVLINLVSNAIKFTPSGGSVTLGGSRRGDLIALSVSDTGVGIPADKLEFVFDEFAQIEADQLADQQGTGLGLPLSRRLAELMAGRIEVSSEVGAGSVFTITLPASSEVTDLLIASRTGDPAA